MYQKKERKKRKRQSLESVQEHKKKRGVLNVIKQLKHFILCNMMRYGVLKNNIAFQCPITHHIALNEVQ